MQIKTIKKVKNDISYIKISSSFQAIVDVDNIVYKYKNFKLINAFKIKLTKNKIFENTVKISDDFKYLLIATPSKPLTLWDIDSKKLLSKFDWHRGDVLSVAFGEDYFLSGGIDGKIFLYSFDLLKMVTRVARYKDFISDLEMDNQTVYAGSYDKSVLFIDTDSLIKIPRALHIDKVMKISLKNTLFSASKKSEVINWDILKKDKQDKVIFYKEFRDFCIGENYAFVLYEKGVGLYDLDNQVIINEKFVEIEAQKIAYLNDKLYLAQHNELLEVTLVDESELIDDVLNENYKDAYEKVLNNPFLKKTEAYEKLEKIYKLTLKKAIKHYEAGAKTLALEELKPFMSVSVKREEIAKFMRDFENFLKFKKAYENKNYALLYDIAHKYPLLKNTKIFKIVEMQWQEAFEKAKKYASEGLINQTKEILKDFIAVSEKYKLIDVLLKKAEIFRLLSEKLAKKDYRGFYDLIKDHPQLKDSKEYKELIKYAQDLYQKAQKALKEENFRAVAVYLNELEEIEEFRDKAKELNQKLQIYLRFLKLFSENKNEAFKLFEEYPFLKELSVYKIYEEKWQKKLKQAEKLAFNGKIKDSLQTLKEYREIDKKKNRIKNMIKSAYLNHIAQKRNSKIIDLYIKNFGNDEELKKALNFNKK